MITKFVVVVVIVAEISIGVVTVEFCDVIVTGIAVVIVVVASVVVSVVVIE